MFYLILLLLLLGLIFGPQWWATYTFRRYSKPRSDIPGSGAELARHLLKRMQITAVGVEQTDKGDHYDPLSRTVRLSAVNFDTHSLTAIAVAAHEVGHAIQHHREERLLTTRTHLITLAHWAQKMGAMLMFAIPLVTLITRLPHSGLLFFVLGFASMGLATLVHLLTLPVEWDASFNKALPLLQDGRYIAPEDERAVRRILRAAALTYVAASLASLLNLARWLAFLRR
ncbi:MAG: zinc metallopeptidase [Gammaproteobacteria bacterium]|nr:zinc metallopeptidase [Gammaproteobacteria bacterium]